MFRVSSHNVAIFLLVLFVVPGSGFGKTTKGGEEAGITVFPISRTGTSEYTQLSLRQGAGLPRIASVPSSPGRKGGDNFPCQFLNEEEQFRFGTQDNLYFSIYVRINTTSREELPKVVASTGLRLLIKDPMLAALQSVVLLH